MKFLPFFLVFLLAGCAPLAFTDTPTSLKGAWTVTTQTEVEDGGLYEYTDWIQIGNENDDYFWVYWETWDGDTFVKSNIKRFEMKSRVSEYSFPGQFIINGEQGTHIIQNTYYYTGGTEHDCDTVFKYTLSDGTEKTYRYVCDDLEYMCRGFQKDKFRLAADERCPAWDAFRKKFDSSYQYSKHANSQLFKYVDPQPHKICVGSCNEIVTEFVESVVIKTCTSDADCAAVDGICLTADNGQSYCVKEVIKETEVEKITVIYEDKTCDDLPFKLNYECVDSDGGAYYVQKGQDINLMGYSLVTVLAFAIPLLVLIALIATWLIIRGR